MTEQLYRVGGAVRDSFMGRESHDVDFAVETSSFERMRELILERGGRIWQERPQFATIRAQMPQLGDADFVMCRRDGFYADGRRPESIEAGSILDDLARRDFTMNAIAIRVRDAEVFDPFNGRQDISLRMIRTVREPAAVFAEDRLRILRALRFSVSLGFRLAPSICQALLNRQVVQGLEGASTERIREELTRMFQADTVASINLLAQFPLVLNVINERGLWMQATTRQRN